MDQFSFLYSPAAAALGYAILYSLGQAFVIFLCLRIVLKFIPNAAATIKYLLSYCAYLGIGSWFFVTLFRQFSQAQQQVVIELYFNNHSFVNTATDNTSSATALFSLSFLYDYLPLIVAFYLMGIVVYSIRFSFNIFHTSVLKSKGLHQLDFEWNEHIISLAKRMNISRKIQACFSSKVNTPMMIGFIKPVILLPLAAMNHLSPEQFEAILFHELAHIRRNDYLLNLIQTVLDTLLFFNPFTWWISRYIREEREKSCDEMVLELSDPFHYARALLALEEPLKDLPLVMTAVNNRSHLFQRIKNIMEMKNKQINYGQKIITLFVIALATVSVAWLSPDESKLNKKEFQQGHDVKSNDVSALQVFSFYPFNFLTDSTPGGLTPVPPIPPTPPVAMQHNGVRPLPPSPSVEPAEGPMPPLPPVLPLPPHLLADTIPSGFFNSEEWKKQEEAIRKSTEEMRRYFQSDAWKKQQDLMKENALAMKGYFNSPEWKKQQQLIKKNAEGMKKYFKSPEWKKQQQLMKKNAEEMKKYFNGPEWKKQQELMKKNGEEIKRYFKSPEWKKQQEEIRHATDSLSTYFKSDYWKKQVENLQNALAKSAKFTGNTIEEGREAE